MREFIIVKEDELEMEEYRYYCTYDSIKPALQDWHLAIGEWSNDRYIIIETNSCLYPLGYTIKPSTKCLGETMEILENGNIKLPCWEVVFWDPENEDDWEFDRIEHFINKEDAFAYTSSAYAASFKDNTIARQPEFKKVEFVKPWGIEKDSPEWHAWCQGLQAYLQEAK